MKALKSGSPLYSAYCTSNVSPDPRRFGAQIYIVDIHSSTCTYYYY